LRIGRKSERRRSGRTCRDEVGLIADYLEGRLKPAVQAAFEKHLGQCPDCAAFLNTYKKTIELSQSFLKITAAPGALTFSLRVLGAFAALISWLHLFLFNPAG
jgi:anti-sigma factor RsiW